MSTANDKQSKTVGQMSTCWSSHEGLEKMLQCHDGSVLTWAKIFPVTFSGNECWTLKKQEEKRLWTLERTPKEIVASQEKQTHDGTFLEAQKTRLKPSSFRPKQRSGEGLLMLGTVKEETSSKVEPLGHSDHEGEA